MKRTNIFNFALVNQWLSKVLLFSCVYNILLLVPSWYMLEVYDRVVMSRNLHTLGYLTILAVALLVLLEGINWVRSDIFYKSGLIMLERYREQILRVSIRNSLNKDVPFSDSGMGDLHQLSSFLSSPILTALLDVPFALIFMLLLYSIHFVLGHVALAVTILVAFIAIINERSVHPALQRSNDLFRESQRILNNVTRNAEVIRAMRMASALCKRWLSVQRGYVNYQTSASLEAVKYQTTSRQLQLVLSSLMMGVSCYLLLTGEPGIGGSTLIVASILAGRFLSPLVQVIAGWKHVDNAYDAYERLQQLLEQSAFPQRQVELPEPTGRLSVESASVKLSSGEGSILKQIDFQLPAKNCLALIGPSGSGKSTLAKLLVGALPAHAGSVRLDGASIFDWDKSQLGKYIGYLPQDIELYEGTIAENIARFDKDIDESRVLSLINKVGLDEFIATLSEGIHTRVTAEGSTFPGGKKQLIGLCRAIYSQPKVLVLDEPNSNLDREGETGLKAVISECKASGTTIVLITHQLAYLQFADYLLLMVSGEMRLYGPTAEVMNKLNLAKSNIKPESPSNSVLAS